MNGMMLEYVGTWTTSSFEGSSTERSMTRSGTCTSDARVDKQTPSITMREKRWNDEEEMKVSSSTLVDECEKGDLDVNSTISTLNLNGRVLYGRIIR